MGSIGPRFGRRRSKLHKVNSEDGKPIGRISSDEFALTVMLAIAVAIVLRVLFLAFPPPPPDQAQADRVAAMMRAPAFD